VWTIVDKSLVRPNIDDSREGYFLSKYTWVVTCRQLSFVAQAFDSEDKMADGHRTVIKTKVAGLIGNTMPFLHSQLTLRYSILILLPSLPSPVRTGAASHLPYGVKQNSPVLNSIPDSSSISPNSSLLSRQIYPIIVIAFSRYSRS